MTAPLAEEALAELERLSEAIRCDDDGECEWSYSDQDGPPLRCCMAQVFDCHGNSLASLDPTDDKEVASNRARLIAEFRNALPALLREIRELRAEVMKAKSVMIPMQSRIAELRAANEGMREALRPIVMAAHETVQVDWDHQELCVYRGEDGWSPLFTVGDLRRAKTACEDAGNKPVMDRHYATRKELANSLEPKKDAGKGAEGA